MVGRWKSERIEKILISLIFVWLEWKNGGMEKVNLYKFTHTALLKNHGQLKQKSDKQPKKKKKITQFIKKKKSCLVKTKKKKRKRKRKGNVQERKEKKKERKKEKERERGNMPRTKK